jgi:hypothetical protein
MLKLIHHVQQAAWHELRDNRPGGFQLYGFDFMLDTDMRSWLLEASWCMYTSTPCCHRERERVCVCVKREKEREMRMYAFEKLSKTDKDKLILILLSSEMTEHF